VVCACLIVLIVCGIVLTAVCVLATALGVEAILGVDVTVGVLVLHVLAAEEEAASCCCLSFFAFCILDCNLSFTAIKLLINS
jgi:hypothetical protein